MALASGAVVQQAAPCRSNKPAHTYLNNYLLCCVVLQVRTGPVTLASGAVVEQASTVHIKKCRYLEASGCVGLCVNLCKVGSFRVTTSVTRQICSRVQSMQILLSVEHALS